MIPQSRDIASEMLNRIRRVAIILNPKAGSGTAGRMRNEVEAVMALALGNLHDIVSWQLYETTGVGSATELARTAVDAGVHVVVAAGGDGTLCEVLNGIIGSDVKLAVIPLGTGNDFARTIGIGLTIKSAVLTIFYGDPVKIDVGKIRDRHFINVAGCGFDAVVADRLKQGTTRLKGKAAYVSAVYRSLRDFDPVEMKITLDGETRKFRALLCAVANARSYGGGMRVAPDALLNDGVFDVCVVSAGKWQFVKSFPRVFRGTHITHPDVFMARAGTVRVETEKPICVMADGDMLGSTPAEFSLIPRAVTFIGPERQPGSDGEQYGLLDTYE